MKRLNLSHCVLPLTLLAFLAALGAQAAPGQSSAPLKVLELNFNSEIVPIDPDYMIRDLRFNALVHWVQENSPDIIFMEEAWSYRHDRTISQTTARAIGYDVAYHLEMGAPKFFYEAVAVLTRKGLGMKDERDIKLPHSALEIGNGKTWVISPGAVSYAVGVKLTLPNGAPLYAYGMHLTSSTAAERADGAEAVIQNVKAWTASDGIAWKDANVIVGGDFNSATTEPAPNALIQSGFEDSFAVAHPGDSSCSDCEQPESPWYDPMALAAGQFPSQAAEDSELRDDYVFIHSPTEKTLASGLIFTAPYRGVWMSDHYGTHAVFGDDETPSQMPIPSHDSTGMPDTQILTLTNDQFRCPFPTDTTQSPQSPGCELQLPPITVTGARGLTVENQTNYYVELSINGPGHIFTTHSAGLNSGERATFSFNTPGEFDCSARIAAKSSSSDFYTAKLNGSVKVQSTGY